MIKESLIFLDSNLKNKEDILSSIIDQAVSLNLLNDIREFENNVKHREEMMPTSVGFNVAIPHGRCKGVKEPFISFVRTKKQFVWDERNNNKVDLIFLIAVPEENENNIHLRFLSEISKKLMNEEFRAKLYQAKNKKDVYKLLNEINNNVKEENK